MTLLPRRTLFGPRHTFCQSGVGFRLADKMAQITSHPLIGVPQLSASPPFAFQRGPSSEFMHFTSLLVAVRTL